MVIHDVYGKKFIHINLSIAAVNRPVLRGHCLQAQCDQHIDQFRDRDHILWFVAGYSLTFKRGNVEPMRNKLISNDREFARANVA